MHIKMIVRYHFSLMKLAKIEKTLIPRTEEGKEKQVLYFLLVGVYIGRTFLEDREQVLKICHANTYI